eukprot:350628-Chlamydomonas_euryale.AAC.8
MGSSLSTCPHQLVWQSDGRILRFAHVQPGALWSTENLLACERPRSLVLRQQDSAGLPGCLDEPCRPQLTAVRVHGRDRQQGRQHGKHRRRPFHAGDPCVIRAGRQQQGLHWVCESKQRGARDDRGVSPSLRPTQRCQNACNHGRGCEPWL